MATAGELTKRRYLHAVLYNILCWVTVSEPEEPKKVMMVLSDFETMEHLLDVGCDGYGFLMKSKKDSQQVIVQIRARQQDVVEGDAMMLGTRVDKLFFHLWFLFKGTLQRIESIKSLFTIVGKYLSFLRAI